MMFSRQSETRPGPLAMTLRLSPARARLVVLAAAALVTLLLLGMFRGPLGLLEERLGSEAWKIGASDAPEQRITVIAIDERSLAEVGPWPWTRETMAQLSTALEGAGAQLQIYDVAFPEARPGDDAFVAALGNTRAVLAQTPVMGAHQTLQAGTLTHPIGGVNCSTGLPVTQNFVANNSRFSALPKGHITTRVGSDGGIRQVPALVCVEGNAYPALAISALLTMAGAPADEWRGSLQPGSGWLAPDSLLSLDAYPGLEIPLDADGDIRIPYDQRPESYRALSALDVLRGDFDPAMLDNTVALVGATAFGLGDVVPTPYSGSTPGVELQARLLGGLLDAALPHTPRSAGLIMPAISLVFAALLLGLTAFRPHRVVVIGLPLAALTLPVLAYGLHAVLLNTAGLWLGWVEPALFAALAASALLLLEHSRVRLEHNRVYGNLHSYLPADVARDIAYSLPTSDVNARRTSLTVLNADLRNFSAYTEARPPEESAALLHRFFIIATDIVERNEGRVHEFRGDGLLAVWSGGREGVQQSLKAAEEMQVAMQRDLLPAQEPVAGLEPLGLGIGIEQGSVLVGSIGPANRRSHALLGDTVAIALRVQEMTVELALPILLGENAGRVYGESALRSQGRYLLTGLRVPQTLYAPAPGTDSARQGDGPALTVVSGGRQRSL